MQRRSVAWHNKRFPRATLEHVALKLAEEAGEVCGAVIAQAGTEHPERAGTVLAEAAQVLNVLLVLLGRWFPDADLADAFDFELAELEDRLMSGNAL